jgi:hypothetical protein
MFARRGVYRFVRFSRRPARRMAISVLAGLDVADSGLPELSQQGIRLVHIAQHP